MAATVIDALVVTLSLNGSQFRQGSVQAQEQLKKTENQARRSAGNIEKSAAQATEFFRKLRNQVAALSAAYLSFSGIRAWTERLNQQDAALGRSATAMGATTEGLAALGAATERAGGSAGDMTATMRRMATQVQELSLYGTSDLVPFLTRLNINIAQFIRAKPEERMRLLNRAVQGMDPQRARAILEGLGGLSEGVANLVLMPTGRFDDLIRKSGELNKVTREDTEAAIRRKNAWLDFTDSLNNAFRPILTAVTPLLVDIVKQVTDWVQGSRDWLQTGIVGAVRDFRDFLKTIDWEAVKQGLHEMWVRINAVVEKLGGWNRAAEIVLGLFVISKLSPVLTGLAALTSGIALVSGALSSPVVLAAIAAWMAYYEATQRFKLPESAQEYDQQMRRLAPGSPLWRGIPEEDQSNYVNSPRSQEFLEWSRKYLKGSQPGFLQRMRDRIFGPKAASFSGSQSEFYDQAYQAVLTAARAQGVENPEAIARLGAAQAANESGYGRHAPNNNYFGIKGPGGQQTTQEFVNGRWVTTQANFRGYGSLEESAADYVRFLRENPRYRGVLAAKTADEAIAAQGQTGYATDPAYGAKLAAIDATRAARLREAQALARQAPYGSGRWDSPAAGGTSATEVHVNGPITVNGAKDADQTAKMLTAALHKRVGDLMAFNYGLA
jgi:flagellum-specific peptidoglycan hydrolase FlgJ